MTSKTTTIAMMMTLGEDDDDKANVYFDALKTRMLIQFFGDFVADNEVEFHDNEITMFTMVRTKMKII